MAGITSGTAGKDAEGVADDAEGDDGGSDGDGAGDVADGAAVTVTDTLGVAAGVTDGATAGPDPGSGRRSPAPTGDRPCPDLKTSEGPGVKDTLMPGGCVPAGPLVPCPLIPSGAVAVTDGASAGDEAVAYLMPAADSASMTTAAPAAITLGCGRSGHVLIFSCTR